ncbi:DNA-processing protein DprA [Candidatus Dependentiae bacterium]
MSVIDSDKKVLLHLCLVQGIGPSSILKILKKFLGEFFIKKSLESKDLNLSLEKIYNYNHDDFIKKIGITNIASDLIVNGLKDKDKLEKEIELIEKYKIDIITFLDIDYPQDLKEIYMPPIVLYCKGKSLNQIDKKFAVVGSRKAKAYAKNVIDDIVPELVKSDYAIVSGGALGVDSMAHRATLNALGTTIVILGSGLMYPYPVGNKKLFREVVKQGGTIVSPFPLQFPAKKGNFPARNRIIAGLSSGCLVVQAAKKSGALITAKFALDEGRHVFAVPGSIYDELSVGCHNLIKQGAKLVNSIDDILEDFGQVNTILLSDKNSKNIKEKKEIVKNTVSVAKPNSKDEQFLNFIQKPISLDDLSIKADIDLNTLQEKLFDLQLEGKVKQNIAGFWELE